MDRVVPKQQQRFGQQIVQVRFADAQKLEWGTRWI